MANLTVLLLWLILLVTMVAVSLWSNALATTDALGMNWGMQAMHPLPQLGHRSLHVRRGTTILVKKGDPGCGNQQLGTRNRAMVSVPASPNVVSDKSSFETMLLCQAS
jgi:hypothetical protein